jgi:hypothetical protein
VVAVVEQQQPGPVQLVMRPFLFLDFDDVICLNRPYGGYDVAARERPQDLWEKLWHAPAVALLEGVVTELHPHVVLTTSWLQFLQLEEAKALFEQTRMPWLADAIHPDGEALQGRGWTRLQAVDAWLAAHWQKEPYAIVDDTLSGTGLVGSQHDRAGRLVLCDVDVGLQPHHIPTLRRALTA